MYNAQCVLNKLILITFTIMACTNLNVTVDRGGVDTIVTLALARMTRPPPLFNLYISYVFVQNQRIDFPILEHIVYNSATYL